MWMGTLGPSDQENHIAGAVSTNVNDNINIDGFVVLSEFRSFLSTFAGEAKVPPGTTEGGLQLGHLEEQTRLPERQ